MDSTWSDRLAGMDITSNREGVKGFITTLVGTLRDQAELGGVLNNLYELHMPLLTVEVFKQDKREERKKDLENYDLESDEEYP